MWPHLKAAGIAPFSLGGQSKWPQLMWLEYLTDRIGGPEVFQAIQDNKPNAWSDPAVIQANTMIQQLVDAGGFADGFSSIATDSNADLALLYTGKAAMILQGSLGVRELQDQRRRLRLRRQARLDHLPHCRRRHRRGDRGGR